MILVTGGSGLVGSHLIAELVKRGEKVKALYRSKVPDIVNKQSVEWAKGDILDIISLQEAMQQVDYVYHCAAIVSFNPHEKYNMYATNIEGTANVVNTSLAANVKKLCYVSSVAALGRVKTGKEIDERMTSIDETGGGNYGKSKFSAEMEVWRGIGEGLKAIIVNPSIILGTGDWNKGSTKIFKTAFEEFTWYTNGETGFVDVNDVISAMIQLMEIEVSGERFIVNSENTKFKRVFTEIANAFGKKPPYKKVRSVMSSLIWRVEALKSTFTNEASLVTRETAHAAHAIIKYSNNKIKKELPLFNFTPLEQSIKRICKELQQQQNL